MNADLTPVLSIGSATVLFAVTALVLLVRGDLAPAGRAVAGLDGGRRWLLGAAIGLGIIAFTIKLTIVTVLSSFPQHTIDPLLPDPATVVAGPDALPEPAPPPAPLWLTLPEQAPAPAGNPTTPAKVALGERLFHDAALSRDGKVACASCHDVARGAGDDARPTAVGVTAVPGRRNTPTVWNAAFQARLFWDGRAVSLEEQAMGPLVNPDEMGMPSLDAVARRVAALPGYQPLFAAAFGSGDITIDRIAAAIAAYERTLVTADSPYDRFVRGDSGALSPAQQRGMWLFHAVGCDRCHSGPNFSGASLIGPRAPFAALQAGGTAYDGRYRLTEDAGRNGVWRVPSLRNVALTGPWFHNGTVGDLAEAVRIMAAIQLKMTVGEAAGGETALWWQGDRFAAVAPRRLGEAEIADLVAFLHALSSDTLAARRASR